MSDKKFSILITRFPLEVIFGGEEWHTINLAEELRRRGHRVFFMGSCPVLTKELKKRDFLSRKTWGGTPIVTKWAVLRFPIIAIFVFLNLARLLVQFKVRHHINILYCLSINEKILLTPFARLLGIKVIWLEHARVGRWLTWNPFRIFYTWYAKMATVVCVSPQNTEKLKKLVPHVKTIVNGIDLDLFTHIPYVSSSEFLSKSMLRDTKFIGVVARLSKDKGVDYFLKAAAQLFDRYKNLHFLIVGDGPEKHTLRALPRKLGIEKNVHFLDLMPREQIVRFYNLLDICVTPSSEHDPFALVAAEAMACRTPVVVTSVCGVSDAMTDKKDGMIVPPKDSNALANAIHYLLSHPDMYERLKSEGLRLVKEKYSFDRMADDYVKLFNRA